MIWIGIDPGSTGAIAVIEQAQPLDRVRFFDTPIKRIEGRAVIQPELCAEIVLQLEAECDISIERSQPMPAIRKGGASAGHGTIGAFKLGYSFGLWVGILSATGSTYRTVRPQAWKQMLLPRDRDAGDKGLSRRIAIELYPLAEDHLDRVKDHGRAEALLLAHYGRCLKRTGL